MKIMSLITHLQVKPVACGKTIQYITEQGTIINHKQYSIQNRIQNVIHI